MKHSIKQFTFTCAAVLTVTGIATAATRTYSTFDPKATQNSSANGGQGWFNSLNAQTNANGNYITGTTGGAEYRSFYIFNLENLPACEVVTKATLYIQLPTGATAAPAPYGTLSFWDVTSNLIDVNYNANNSTAAGIFTDLGGGASYGTQVYTAAAPPELSRHNAYTLNAIATTDIGLKAGKFFGVGATYSGGSYLWGFTSGAFANLLVLETDEAGCKAGACDTTSVEAQLCELTHLVLTDDENKCVDGLCGAGFFPEGLLNMPRPASCPSSR